MITRKFKKRSIARTGAAAVEFAVVAPAVFAIIWIAFEFTRMTMIQELADIATYEAARNVMVPGAKVAEAHAETSKYLKFLGTRNATVTVTPFQGETPQTEINDYTSRVHVAVSIPCRSNTLLLSRFFGDRNITSDTTLTFESYSGFYDGQAN